MVGVIIIIGNMLPMNKLVMSELKATKLMNYLNSKLVRKIISKRYSITSQKSA